MLCSLDFRIRHYAQSPQNPLIPSVTHHRQNPLASVSSLISRQRGCYRADWKRGIEALQISGRGNRMLVGSICADGKASSQSENEHESKNKADLLLMLGH
jgi:hypothetical protein